MANTKKQFNGQWFTWDPDKEATVRDEHFDGDRDFSFERAMECFYGEGSKDFTHTHEHAKTRKECPQMRVSGYSGWLVIPPSKKRDAPMRLPKARWTVTYENRMEYIESVGKRMPVKHLVNAWPTTDKEKARHGIRP